MPRAADATPLSLDHFLVDPELREIHGDAITAGTHDDPLDGNLRSIGKADRTAYVAAHHRKPIVDRDITNAALRAIHDLESAAPAQK
jgi:hypothetical protein